MIWNHPLCTWEEKLDALGELAQLTGDGTLRRQIRERIAYEEKCFRLFKGNPDKKYVYVVYEKKDWAASGFFSDYETAVAYGLKDIQKYEMREFRIEKQLIFNEDTKKDVIKPWISKHNLLKFEIHKEYAYDGSESASFIFNNEGNIVYAFSMETDAEEMDLVDAMNRDLFESRFFKLPFGMEVGTVVKVLHDNTYGVLCGGNMPWDDYMKKTDEDPPFYDFSDIQTIILQIKADGHWSHGHINPMYLEPGIPEAKEGNQKAQAHVEALWTLSAYLKNNSEENDKRVLKASRKYADACIDEYSKSAYQVDYVYGIGMIESEFYKTDRKYEYAVSGKREDLVLANCIEVMLSKEPKSVLLMRDTDVLELDGLDKG